MITIVHGDIFRSTCQTITCPVNTVGVMGAGLAKQFAANYPTDFFVGYRKRCKDGIIEVGCPWIYKRTHHQWVLCLPTKKDWRLPSQLPWIEAGLQWLARNYVKAGIESLALPPIGCGLGQLDYQTQVGPLIAQYLGYLKLPVEIYLPAERK